MTVSAFLGGKEHLRLSWRERRRTSALPAVTLLLTLPILGFLISDPPSATAAARDGLLRAGTGVIPVLFPFLVLSSCLSESGAGEAVGKRLGRPLSCLLGISGGGASAVLVGLFCGFPVGARMTARLYAAGRISGGERDRLLFLSNGPSFLFLYSAVGNGLYGDTRIGLALYLSAILSTLLVGAMLRAVRGSVFVPKAHPSAEKHETPHAAQLLQRSLSSAVSASLGVAGSIVFFSVISAALSSALAHLNAPAEVSVFLSGLLEFSGGMQNAAETVGGLCGRMLCGCFAGFGGLCAHLQVIATAENPLPDRADRREPPSYRPYFIQKLVSGALSALLFPLLSAGLT